MHKKSLLRKLIMISISMVLFLNISGCNILGVPINQIKNKQRILKEM